MLRASRISGVAAGILGLALVAAAPGAAQRPDTSTVINAPTNPLLRHFRWRSIGPTGQGGRVDDFAVDPTDARTFFVGFATGGLWKTIEQRRDLPPGLRHLRDSLHRGRGHRAVGPEDRVRGHRRGQQPAELVLRRRHVQEHRRRRDLHLHGSAGDPDHRPRPRAPHRLRRRVGGGQRPPVRAQPRARRLQEHRRRRRRGPRC